MKGYVFRASNDALGAKRDRHGDPVDDSGNPVSLTDIDGQAYIGTIDDIWVAAVTPGAPTVSSQSVLGAPSRQESSDSNTTLCCPKSQVILKYGDRVYIGNKKFEIKSDPNWDDVNPLTGTDFGRYYVDALTRIG